MEGDACQALSLIEDRDKLPTLTSQEKICNDAACARASTCSTCSALECPYEQSLSNPEPSENGGSRPKSYQVWKDHEVEFLICLMDDNRSARKPSWKKIAVAFQEECKHPDQLSIRCAEDIRQKWIKIKRNLRKKDDGSTTSTLNGAKRVVFCKRCKCRKLKDHVCNL
jgi:hypothetical protein